MKRVLFFLIGLLVLWASYINAATLEVRIVDKISRTHYICVNNMGCLNISLASRGQYPILPGEVYSIVLTEMHTLAMFPQSLPPSCKTRINEHQNLVISGNVKVGSDNKLYINNLKCLVKRTNPRLSNEEG